MLENIIFALIITLIIFINVTLIKSLRQFFIFKKVREMLLLGAFHYLKRTPRDLVNLEIMQDEIYKKLEVDKLSRWIKELRINWASADKIQFVFKLNFRGLNPQYRLVLGISDIDKISKSLAQRNSKK